MSVYKVDLHLYRLQIIRFLQTLTIKFTPLAGMINWSLLSRGYVIDYDDPTTWKYYMNLVGQYHESDSTMVINSLDTGQPINFTVEELNNNPRTKAAYTPGSTYYSSLCQQYPNQTDLIKNILYPVSDIETALDANDFTILAYGNGFLEETEDEYLLGALTETLDYIQSTQYPQWLSPLNPTSAIPICNPYFYPAFYAQLWHRLTEALLAARFKAIRTVNVHSWHIWQYLESKGIGNYSDIMSREMQLFLYRNLDYLFWNRGKENTLQILNQNILNPLSISLYGRDVYQQTVTNASVYQLTPDFVAVPVSNLNEGEISSIPAVSMSTMNNQLVAAGDEFHTSSEWVEDMGLKLASTTLNKYPTKILELDAQARERQYGNLFTRFLLDTLVLLVSEGVYSTTVPITSPQSNKTIFLSTQDALILLYYCIWREQGVTPTDLPKYYQSQCAYRVTPLPIPESFVSFKMVGNIKNFIDLSFWGESASYSNIIMYPDQFSQELSTHFLQMLQRVLACRATADLNKLKAIYTVVPSIFNTQNNTLKLTTMDTYTEWMNVNSGVYIDLISPCEKSVDVSTAYSSLITTIYSTLVPCTETMVNYGYFSLSQNKYTRLKELFISLCSYNVTFIGNDRDVRDWIIVSQEAIAPLGSQYSCDTFYPLAHVPLSTNSTVSQKTERDIGDVHWHTQSSLQGDIWSPLNIPTESQSTLTSNTWEGVNTLPTTINKTYQSITHIGDLVSMSLRKV